MEGRERREGRGRDGGREREGGNRTSIMYTPTTLNLYHVHQFTLYKCMITLENREGGWGGR